MRPEVVSEGLLVQSQHLRLSLALVAHALSIIRESDRVDPETRRKAAALLDQF